MDWVGWDRLLQLKRGQTSQRSKILPSCLVFWFFCRLYGEWNFTLQRFAIPRVCIIIKFFTVSQKNPSIGKCTLANKMVLVVFHKWKFWINHRIKNFYLLIVTHIWFEDLAIKKNVFWMKTDLKEKLLTNISQLNIQWRRFSHFAKKNHGKRRN